MDKDTIEYKQGMPFYPVTFPINQADGLVIEDLRLQDLLEYLNNNEIKSAYITYMRNYEFLKQCQNLEHVTVELQVSPRDYYILEMKGKFLFKKYDCEPFYQLKKLKSLSIHDMEEPYILSEFKVDLSQFPKLEEYLGDAQNIENLEKAKQLKSLWLNCYKEESLTKISALENIDTLKLISSKIKSLAGCENFKKLQCLYLHYNRSLSDISALRCLKHSLKALRIENCAKINDFSPLEELEELELLELSGSNKIPNLSFIKKMKKLKTFLFSVEILDGDLTPCLDLEYVFCGKGRKYYNLKNKDFSLKNYARGNESIEMWRRFE